MIEYNSLHFSIFKNIERKIEKLKLQNMFTPAQGSEKWHNMRSTGVGGSEVAGLLGLSGWTNRKKIIEKKTGMNKSNFNFNTIACNWGTVMENITIKITVIN